MTDIEITTPQHIIFQRTTHQLSAVINQVSCDIRVTVDDTGMYTWLRSADTGDLMTPIKDLPDNELKTAAIAIASSMITGRWYDEPATFSLDNIKSFSTSPWNS
jgi:hypothetical protein